MTFTATDGQTTRLLLTSPHELSMVKKIGGEKLAEHLEKAVKLSADMPNEMRLTVQKGLDDLIRTNRPAAEKLAGTLTKQLSNKERKAFVGVDDLPNMLDEIGKVMDKTIVSYIDDSGQMVNEVFTSYNPIVYNYKLLPREISGNPLVNGLKSNKPARISGAHAEVFGMHRVGDALGATGRSIPDNAVMVKVVYGRKICRRCLVNIPTQARNMGIHRLLLFEVASGKAMLWKPSMVKDELIYMGMIDQFFDRASLTTKGLAFGGSRAIDWYEKHESENMLSETSD